MGPTVFHPYPRRLESLTICSCHYKGSTFFSVIQRPWVLVQLGFEPATSCSADRRSPNWPNQGSRLFVLTEQGMSWKELWERSPFRTVLFTHPTTIIKEASEVTAFDHCLPYFHSTTQFANFYISQSLLPPRDLCIKHKKHNLLLLSEVQPKGALSFNSFSNFLAELHVDKTQKLACLPSKVPIHLYLLLCRISSAARPLPLNNKRHVRM